MKIHPIPACNSLQNIFYILEYGNKEAIVIDPCDTKICEDYLLKYGLKLQKICITHEHYDHYEWVEGLRCNYIYAWKIAANNMPVHVSHIFEDGEEFFRFDWYALRAVHTPGHAEWHMTFEYSHNNTIIAVFSGDVLFQWWVWHTRNGSNLDLYESIQKFKQYDDTITIYSGHDYLNNNAKFIEKYAPDNIDYLQKIVQKREKELYFTSLWEERSYNPFIQSQSLEEFRKLRELRNNF